MKHFSIFTLFAAILILGAGCASSNGPTGTSADSIINEAEKTNTVNSLPDNLITCDQKYFERGADGIAPSCTTFSGDPVCSYYTKEQNGSSKNLLMQFDNACAACRFFNESGIRKIGTTIMTHLGYTEKKCAGTMWK